MKTQLIAAIVALAPMASQTAFANTDDSGVVIQEELETEFDDDQFKINVSANAVFLAFGGLQGGVSFRVDYTKAIGVVGSTLSLLGSKVSTLGVQVQHHLQNGDVMGDGLILDGSAELLFASYDFGYGYDDNAQESHMGALGTASVNYQWFHGNGFNFRVGAGVATTIGLDETVGYTGAGGAGIATLSDSVAIHGFIDGKVAWAF